MTEHYYDFKIQDQACGYSYLFWDDQRLHSFTRFRLPDGQVITNVFRLLLKEEAVERCRHNDLPWVDLTGLPEDHYPGCAYPLLLDRSSESPFPYVQVSEDDGAVTGNVTLERAGDVVLEKSADRVLRRFFMQGKTPIMIDWGGAVSELCGSGRESAEGSGFEFHVDPF